MYAKYERKKMVQLIQNFINSLTLSSVSYGDSHGSVDPNLVRYFRTEYGRNWKAALNEHLYNQSKR